MLAISSLMMVFLFNGYTSSRQRAQFTAAIEQVTTRMEQAKNEANGTLNTNPSSPPSSAKVVFAKVIDFTLNTDPACASSSGQAGQFRVHTVTADRADSLSGLGEDCASVQSVSIPWGITFMPVATPSTSTYEYVAFTRNVGDGRLNTFVLKDSPPGTPLDLRTAGNYTAGGTEDTATAEFWFTSPQGLQAKIKVNANNNEISREYLN